MSVSTTTTTFSIIVPPQKPKISVTSTSTPGVYNITVFFPTGSQYITSAYVQVNGTTYPLTNQGGGLWSTTVQLPAGINIITAVGNYNISGYTGQVSSTVSISVSTTTRQTTTVPTITTTVTPPPTVTTTVTQTTPPPTVTTTVTQTTTVQPSTVTVSKPPVTVTVTQPITTTVVQQPPTQQPQGLLGLILEIIQDIRKAILSFRSY